MKKRDNARDNIHWRQKRNVMPGFPREGKFQTKEEIDTYLGGEKIQCLLCGKWYIVIGHNHLKHIHDMTVDEYRERYGLPWTRGLTSDAYRRQQGAATKRRMREGSLHPPDLQDEQLRQKAQASPRRSFQPFAQQEQRRHLNTLAQRRRAQTTINDMQRLAASRGGTCLSAAYIDGHSKLRWQCAEGHQWKATPHSIKHGSWCPVCAKQKRAEASRLDIEAMQQLAASRRGTCLSTAYINTRTKLEWQCAEGHQWKATPGSIKHGNWCPVCARQRSRTGIETMRHLAASRGGMCLSTTYINTETKLEWQCAEGHRWASRPTNIHRGHWCPVCARLKRKNKHGAA